MLYYRQYFQNSLPVGRKLRCFCFDVEFRYYVSRGSMKRGNLTLILLNFFIIFLLSSCQKDSNTSLNNTFPINKITIDNRVEGIDLKINEANIMGYHKELMEITYTITNQTKRAIDRSAYKLTFRGYSNDKKVIFEDTDNWLFDYTQLDSGKMVDYSFNSEIGDYTDVNEVVIILDKDISWPGWW